MKEVKVELQDRSYSIFIGCDSFDRLKINLENLYLGNFAVIITNYRIQKLYFNKLKQIFNQLKIKTKLINTPDTERSKSIKECVRLIDTIASLDKQKKIFVVSFGGGVIGDLAGFVASIYKRGIPYIQVPTTLLSQVDSSIGGKVGVDLKFGKNLAGSFYQPKLVFSEISFLNSLNLRQIKSGLAEVIKYAVVSSPQLFRFLEIKLKTPLTKMSFSQNDLEYIIYICSKIKASIVSQDERDIKGIRARLNLGHTIGHAIEQASGYSKNYTHGEAISIGIFCALKIALRLNLISKAVLVRIENLIKQASLPTTIKDLKVPDIIEAHWHDKKFINGVNRFILPTKIGNVKIVENISKSLIRQVIKESIV